MKKVPRRIIYKNKDDINTELDRKNHKTKIKRRQEQMYRKGRNGSDRQDRKSVKYTDWNLE